MAWLFKYLLLLSDRIVHDPCILSLAIYIDCICKLSKIYDFDIGKKSEGLLEIFFMCKRF
jgi:hypothetical protein